MKERDIRSVIHAIENSDASRVGPTNYEFKRSIRKYALDGQIEASTINSGGDEISQGEIVKQAVPDKQLNVMCEEMANQQKQHHYRSNSKHLAGDAPVQGIEPGDPRHGYERRVTDKDVRTTMRHQMDKGHRNTTFLQFIRKLMMAIQSMENEKLSLLKFKDFNLNDAFKVLAFNK